jgi:crotonobetainyl-CoA:carnitine CoA-transferase CaiB-like acyl-CoA transferase
LYLLILEKADILNIRDIFQDISVLELSSVLAGPLAGSFFSECGAKVTKVENKTAGGDITRQWKLKEENPESTAGAYYYAANYNKEILLLNFADRDEFAQLLALVVDNDIILSNFQKRVAQKYDLEPHKLFEKYPDKIIVQLNAYDYDDPRPGFDLIMQAETGFISMNGTESGELCKMPVAMIDIMASHQIREAILIALLKKEKTGLGSLVHISLFQSGIASLANQASNYLMAGVIPGPMGTLHPNIAPYGDLFRSSDGVNFFLGIGSDHQFKKLWETLNFFDQNDVTFVRNQDRLFNRKALHEILQSVFSLKTIEFLSSVFQNCDIPFAVIKNLKEVFESPLCQSMILTQTTEEGTNAYSVSNIAFRFQG